jgi:hypothetical protein
MDHYYRRNLSSSEMSRSDLSLTQDSQQDIKNNEQLDDILIDFFLTIGLPKDLQCDIIRKIYTERKGDFSSEKTYLWLERYLEENFSLWRREKANKDTKELVNKSVLSFYPDSMKIGSNDSRHNSFNFEKKCSLPSYAFPLGFNIKHQEHQPVCEQLPMAFFVGTEKTYI